MFIFYYITASLAQGPGKVGLMWESLENTPSAAEQSSQARLCCWGETVARVSLPSSAISSEHLLGAKHFLE